MATIVAQANGNFSSAATWAGGVVPGAGDIAQTGNFLVTIDASITCTLNPTGSGYFLVTSGGITITGDLVMQSSAVGGLRATHGSGTVALGTATGGAVPNAYGAYNAGAGTLTVGTATGGAGSNAHGAHNAGAGTLTAGTATGGAGSYAHGAYNAGAGTLTVGTATGGAGIEAYGARNGGAGGTMHVDLAIGNDYGPGGPHSNPVPGVYGSNAVASVTTVKRTQSGAYGQAAIGGSVLLADDIANSAQFRKIHNGATKTLTDAAATADFPAATDVRHGVEYNYTNLVGTAHIPAAGSVALGIPVDATVGTAVLTAAAVTAGVWDAARSGHAGAGTFGATDEWAGSVDEAAIADAVLSAMDAAPPAVNVTLWKGEDAGSQPLKPAVPGRTLNVDENGKTLMGNGAHGGSSATLTLKNVVVRTNEVGGSAVEIASVATGGTGLKITSSAWKGMEVAGSVADIEADIAGSVNSVAEGVSLVTEAINVHTFDISALQAIADAMGLAPTGAPAAGSLLASVEGIEKDTGVTLPATLDALPAEVDAKLSGAHGAGEWGGAGAWPKPFVYTLTNTATGQTIASALIEVYADIGMTALVDQGVTDAYGRVRFELPPGTYYFKRTKTGWDFTNPDTEVQA